jgi:hypothetical protein
VATFNVVPSQGSLRRVENLSIERQDRLHPVDANWTAVKDNQTIRSPAANDLHHVDIEIIGREIFQQSGK